LRYASATLGGCERDLARARGVGAADRDEFLATATAVLHRRPAAVRTLGDLLTGARDRAAANLAFELAARIQQEIEAVGWVVAEQKVTQVVPAAGDRDVYGWADGLLVRLRFAGGRLCGWEQRTCVRAAAQPLLERTPEGWATFAARAAELARRLSGYAQS
jgi:excinuclease ABC subunit C